MSQDTELVCPWCQSEIVWDPEIGPEEECPHCYNELSGYRTLSLHLESDEEDMERADTVLEEEDNDVEWQEETFDDGYGAMVERLLDEQEEAPVCASCHEPMLFAGMRKIESAEFQADIPGLLGKSFLNAPIDLMVYVCPSCFRTESLLADRNRLEMIAAIRDSLTNKNDR